MVTAAERRVRGNVDDRPLRRAQLWNRRATNVKHAVDVDVHRLQPLFVAGLLGGRVVDHAGRVDDDVETPEPRHAVGDDAITGFAFGDVAGDEFDRTARGLAGPYQLVRALTVAPVDDDIRAGLDQGLRGRGADARGAAGDQRAPALEIELQAGPAHAAPVIAFSSRNSARPHLPFSRPLPDCL